MSAKLEAISSRVRAAEIAVLDAARIIRESQPAATMDNARMRLAEATGELAGAVNLIEEAMADPKWCDGCGEGAGVVEEHGEAAKSRGAVPCPVCASVVAKAVSIAATVRVALSGEQLGERREVVAAIKALAHKGEVAMVDGVPVGEACQ